MNQATGLDHVGIVGPDLPTLAAAFDAMGFYLTPLARHAGGRTGNRCAIFAEGGYLELMSTVDGGTSATLEKFLARHAGAHTMALGMEDEAAVKTRLRRAWGTAPDVSHTDRAVDDNDPDGPRVRFSLLRPPDRPEGRVYLVHHETPDALWQTRFLRHPNNVIALHEVVLSVPEPAVTAAWYSQLTGRPVLPDPAGGFAVALGHGRVRLAPPGSFAAPAPPCIAEIALRTADANRAIRALLHEGGYAYTVADDDIKLQIGGVTIRFV